MVLERLLANGAKVNLVDDRPHCMIGLIHLKQV